MMHIEPDKSLADLHTFRMPVTCARFISFEQEGDVLSFLQDHPKELEPLMVIGQGSNMLFTKPVDGTVIKLNTKGIDIEQEDQASVVVRVAGGEVWDDVVAGCVARGWGGLENLSLIPGLAGAAPIQNIGAYGTEIRDVLISLDAVSLADGSVRTFSRDACRFGYRESIFKDLLRNQYLILSLRLRLSRQPSVQTQYRSLNQLLQRKGVTHPTIRDVRDAVCEIRTQKLPDPKQIPNAGSFFMNPVIRSDQFKRLAMQHPGIVSFPDPDGIKLAAAWLIEQCGWKGKRLGDAGVHPDQPLVLVNYGSASGEEILELAYAIRESVLSRFGIMLKPEVNII